MEIIFYSTHCPRCKVLEAKMKEAKIEYTEVNDLDEMQKLGIMSVPMLKVDGEMMDFVTANSWINKEVKARHED